MPGKNHPDFLQPYKKRAPTDDFFRLFFLCGCRLKTLAGRLPMKLYAENQKPFVYAVFTAQDEVRAVPFLEKINEDSVSFWYADRLSKKELRRIEAAYSCLLFVSPGAVRDERVWRSIEHAVKNNKKILCIVLEPVSFTPGQELLLNSLQSMNYSNDEAFFEKLKSAEVFSGMQITAAQKKFAKRKGLASVLVPVSLAAIVFLTVVVPLLVLPMVQASTGSLSRLGFGNLGLDDLAKVEHLYVVGDQSFDQWYYAFYTGSKNDVYVNGLGTTLPVGDISDISDIALLKNAKEIAFEANQISDISPLFGIKSLENLTLNCNPIRSIEGIEALSNLKSVTLVCTDISDISPLFNIPSLQSISFEETYVSSIDGIEKLNHLCGLRAGNSNLTDLSPLNRIDFSYINDMEGGFEFESKNSLIKDFSPLGRIPKFNEIMVETKRLDSLLPYISNKQVRRLYLIGSDINTVGQLDPVQNIQALDLTRSYALASISGIENHPDITEVNLVGCPNLTDLSPLLKLPKLQRLTLDKGMENMAAGQLAGAGFEIVFTEG